MRRLAALCIGVFLVCCPITLSQAPKPRTAPCAAPRLPYTPGELQDIFKTYNRTYWDGKLPETVVVWTALPGKLFGQTHQEADGRFVIKLDSAKNGYEIVAKTTILHEMAHIKTWGDQCHITGQPDQCSRWLAEIHRIMLEGAFDDLI
jgi:hypothetical protein